jgi:26S proteasome regulatory subunit T6
MPSLPSTSIPIGQESSKGLTTYFTSKIEQAEHLIHSRTQNLRRLEAQRNALNARVRLLREELQLLQEPGSYVGEVVKVMGKKKVLVKVQPEGKYGKYTYFTLGCREFLSLTFNPPFFRL